MSATVTILIVVAILILPILVILAVRGSRRAGPGRRGGRNEDSSSVGPVGASDTTPSDCGWSEGGSGGSDGGGCSDGGGGGGGGGD